VLGKHSGTAAVVDALRSLGVKADVSLGSALLREVRLLAVAKKRAITLSELCSLFAERVRSQSRPLTRRGEELPARAAATRFE